jgi:hypothetical protein
MPEDTNFIELVRIGDPVQAALLAAFLEDGGIEFHRTAIGMMDPLFPRAARPVIFSVPAEFEERGRELLNEYRRLIDEGKVLPAEDPATDQET